MLMLHQILDTLYNFHVIKQNIFFNVNIFQIYSPLKNPLTKMKNNRFSFKFSPLVRGFLLWKNNVISPSRLKIK